MPTGFKVVLVFNFAAVAIIVGVLIHVVDRRAPSDAASVPHRLHLTPIAPRMPSPTARQPTSAVAPADGAGTTAHGMPPAQEAVAPCSGRPPPVDTYGYDPVRPDPSPRPWLECGAT